MASRYLICRPECFIIAFMVLKGIFAAILFFCFTPYASPPIALALGLLTALTIGHPCIQYNGILTKYLLQVSVAGLGFGMNVTEVVAAGKTGILLTAISISATLAIGYFLGKRLAVNRNTSCLISVGTAICGGSAIAAVAPLINAREEEISVSMGTVFILNSVALFLFPPAGHLLGMTSAQFGSWAAIAIHDTSSVVGAAERFGPEALKTAAVIKLTRALWILPLTIAATVIFKHRVSKVRLPLFIFAFILASLVATLLPAYGPVYASLARMARTGLTVTLFLIGAGLSKDCLRTVGLKPVLFGALLWAIVLTASLLAVKYI